jgi:hypothetical protein
MKLDENSSLYKVRRRIDAKRRNKDLLAFERWREIGEIVIEDLKKRGQFFNTRQGLFFFDAECRRAFPLYKDVDFAASINRRYGINPKEHGFERVLADLQTEAVLNGRKTEVRRFTHYDRKSKRLYVSRFDGYMYKLDGKSVAPVANGTDDVFFFDDHSLWEPYSYIEGTPKGQFDSQLINSVNFVPSFLSVAEQRLFLKLWVLAVFFGNVQPTKIILLLLGEHGSGKTSALRRIQKFIFGSKADLLSIEKDKPDGFVATVTADPLALFDNVDERISWLPYALSRLATGVTFPRRQLYTTNNKLEFPGVSWLAITSRTVGFMENQPDLPDRTLVLNLGRLDDRQPEGELMNAVGERRNELWSELLDELNMIVRYLKRNPKPVAVQFRMADFATFALKVAALWGRRPEVKQAFEKLEEAQSDLAVSEEPIHLILELWLENTTNYGRSVTAGTLYEEWAKLARASKTEWPYANAKRLGQRLRQLQFALRERFGVEVTWDAHSKQNQYRFWFKEPLAREQGAAAIPRSKWPVGVVSAPEGNPTAGFAGLLEGKS